MKHSKIISFDTVYILESIEYTIYCDDSRKYSEKTTVKSTEYIVQ